MKRAQIFFSPGGRIGLIFLLGIMLFLSLAPSANAYVSKAGAKIRLPSCHYVQLSLQGKKPPNVRCLDISVQPTTSVHPNVTNFCGDDFTLEVFWDSNFSGDILCITGSGDLTNICAPPDHGGCFFSWNDAASSFSTDDSNGVFWSDIGQSGLGSGFGAFESGNFDGINGRLANDTLSSITFSSCKANDNLGEIATDFISRCRRASIRQQFPGELYSWTLGAIKNCSQANCKTAWKLLNDNRFTK